MAVREFLVMQPFTLRIVYPRTETVGADTCFVLAWGEVGIGAPAPGWYYFEEGDALFVDGDIRHHRINGAVNEIASPRDDILDELKSRGLFRE